MNSTYMSTFIRRGGDEGKEEYDVFFLTGDMVMWHLRRSTFLTLSFMAR